MTVSCTVLVVLLKASGSVNEIALAPLSGIRTSSLTTTVARRQGDHRRIVLIGSCHVDGDARHVERVVRGGAILVQRAAVGARVKFPLPSRRRSSTVTLIFRLAKSASAPAVLACTKFNAA